jgi:hypothetical protein
MNDMEHPLWLEDVEERGDARWILLVIAGCLAFWGLVGFGLYWWVG